MAGSKGNKKSSKAGKRAAKQAEKARETTAKASVPQTRPASKKTSPKDDGKHPSQPFQKVPGPPPKVHQSGSTFETRAAAYTNPTPKTDVKTRKPVPTRGTANHPVSSKFKRSSALAVGSYRPSGLNPEPAHTQRDIGKQQTASAKDSAPYVSATINNWASHDVYGRPQPSIAFNERPKSDKQKSKTEPLTGQHYAAATHLPEPVWDGNKPCRERLRYSESTAPGVRAAPVESLAGNARYLSVPAPYNAATGNKSRKHSRWEAIGAAHGSRSGNEVGQAQARGISSVKSEIPPPPPSRARQLRNDSGQGVQPKVNATLVLSSALRLSQSAA